MYSSLRENSWHYCVFTLYVRVFGHEHQSPAQSRSCGVSTSNKQICHRHHKILLMKIWVLLARFLSNEIHKMNSLYQHNKIKNSFKITSAWLNKLKNSKWRLTYSDLVQTANFHLPPEYFDYYSKGDHWKIAYLIVLFADEKGVNKPSAVVWIQSPQKRIDQLHHLFSTLDNIVYNNPFVFQERTQPWKYVVELEMDTRETDFV